MLRKFSKITHPKPRSFTVTMTTATARYPSKSTMRPWPCRGKRTPCAQIYPSGSVWPGLKSSRAKKALAPLMNAWPQIWAKIINVIENKRARTKMKSTRTRSCRRYVSHKSRAMSWASPPSRAATLSKLVASFAALIKYLIPDRLIIINGHF